MTTAPSLGSGPLDVERLRPFAQRVAATWADLPAGGQVELHWPGANELLVVDGSDAGAFVPLRRGVVEVIAPGPGP